MKQTEAFNQGPRRPEKVTDITGVAFSKSTDLWWGLVINLCVCVLWMISVSCGSHHGASHNQINSLESLVRLCHLCTNQEGNVKGHIVGLKVCLLMQFSS